MTTVTKLRKADTGKAQECEDPKINQEMTEHKCIDKLVPFGEDDKILETFQNDGFVVVSDVLSAEEVASALDELWESPRLLGRPGLSRHDPSTWESSNWPQSNGGKNFLDSADVFRDDTTFDLPSHPRVVHLQKLLYQRDDIMCDGFGRWGVMRPAANHLEWRTETSWLHWDQNPWSEPDFVRQQAILCLTDNTETSGGFACVPGFHKQFKAWGEQHPMGSLISESGRKLDLTYGVNQPFPVPAGDSCQQQIVRVLAPAGAMVFWDSRLPHQNFPNTDTKNFRVVYYCMTKVIDSAAAGEHQELLRKKAIVMETLGIDKEQRFPHELSQLARELHCMAGCEADVKKPPISDGLRRAIPFVLQAGQAEDRGDTAQAIQSHQKALRLYPEIDSWYGAILG